MGEDAAWWLEVEQDRHINKQQTGWMIYKDSQTDI